MSMTILYTFWDHVVYKSTNSESNTTYFFISFSFFQYIIHTSMAPAKRRADDKIMKKPTLSNTEVSVSLHERLQLNTSNVSILILSSLDFFLVFAIFISAAETFKFFYFNKKRNTHARAHDLFS